MEEEKVNLTQYAENVVTFENAIMSRAKTAADKEAKAIEELAEIKARNLERKAQDRLTQARATRMKNKAAEVKEQHNQIGLVIEEQLRQFIVELQELSLVPVGNCSRRDLVAQRREQVLAITGRMSLIQALTKMQETMETKHHIKKEDAKEGKGDNIRLMRDAKRLMKTASK